MIDNTGQVIAMLRDDGAVAAIVGNRVRGDEPGAGWSPPFVTVAWLHTNRFPFGAGSGRLRLQRVFHSVKCYGTTPEQAIQLYGAVSDAIHFPNPQVDSRERVLLQSRDEPGGDISTDPDTKWPFVDATVVSIAGADALASVS